MSFTFTKATKSSAKLRAALFGPSGAGKTLTALRIAAGLGGAIAVIDTERGSASKYADRFSFDVLDLERAAIPRLSGRDRGRRPGGLSGAHHRQPVPRLAGAPAGGRPSRRRQVPGQHLVGVVGGDAQAARPGRRDPDLSGARHRHHAQPRPSGASRPTARAGKSPCASVWPPSRARASSTSSTCSWSCRRTTSGGSSRIAPASSRMGSWTSRVRTFGQALAAWLCTPQPNEPVAAHDAKAVAKRCARPRSSPRRPNHCRRKCRSMSRAARH